MARSCNGIQISKYLPFCPEAIEPEVDDQRFEEVRVLTDLCEKKGLVYDKIMRKDNEG